MSSDQHGYPLLAGKQYAAASLFRPDNLLREARRQRRLPELAVPEVCVLDPDGDIVRYLAAGGSGRRHPGWACYHTDMWVGDVPDPGGGCLQIGVVGCAVGAPFAVLVAEQLAASGARLVISITSAGQLVALADGPHFVLIDRAMRDEGTSTHYLPPGTWAHLAPPLRSALGPRLASLPERVFLASSWTTDAPFRETSDAIATARDAGAVCVEMEAAALYAYGTAQQRQVVCLAQVTNTMAVDGDDFEKGPVNGATAALAVAAAVAGILTTASRGSDACVLW